MNLSDLIDTLQDILESLDGENPEVMVAFQPSWPMEMSIDDVVHVVKGDDDYEEDCGIEHTTVWLGCGSGNNYLPSVAQRELSWRRY